MFDQILATLPPFIRVFISQLVPAEARRKIDEIADQILAEVANDRAGDLLGTVRELLDYAKIDYQQYRD